MKNLFSLLLIMACVAAGFFLILRTGFILHREPLPAPFDSLPLTAGSALVLATGMMTALAALVRYGTETVTGARIRRESNTLATAFREKRRLHVAELAADPARAQYAPLVERGEDWSEENITYYENAESTITCVHLMPIEQTMRRIGLDLRRFKGQEVLTKCRIDYGALESRFGTAPSIRYAEFYQGERSEYDHPTAFLICDEHKSMIHTVHPEESGALKLPLFPGGSDA